MNRKLFSNIKSLVPLHAMHAFPLPNYEFDVPNKNCYDILENSKFRISWSNILKLGGKYFDVAHDIGASFTFSNSAHVCRSVFLYKHGPYISYYISLGRY